MKITTDDTSVRAFGDVEVGEVFQFTDPVLRGDGTCVNSDTYIRISSLVLCSCDTVNALNLATGGVRSVADFEKVIIFDAELKLKRRA